LKTKGSTGSELKINNFDEKDSAMLVTSRPDLDNSPPSPPSENLAIEYEEQ
jgi:hypothetical protein